MCMFAHMALPGANFPGYQTIDPGDHMLIRYGLCLVRVKSVQAQTMNSSNLLLSKSGWYLENLPGTLLLSHRVYIIL